MLGNNDGLVVDHEVTGIADDLFGNVDLLVGLFVHENIVGAVLVQVRHVATVNGCGFDLETGVEGLVDDLATHHVLNLGAHECGALTRLDVLEFNDLPQLAVDDHDCAVLQIIRRCHRYTSLWFFKESTRFYTVR